MRAGQLDRRITLERKTLTFDPDTNFPIETWQPLVTVSARVQEQPGREFLSEGVQVASEAKAVFTTRYRAGIETTDRIQYAGRVFNIRSTREIGRRAGLEIMAVSTV